MPESFRTRRLRWAFNWFPAYRRSGGRITYIAGDLREVRVRLDLGRRTRNYVGTMYGGSMYGAIDPIYMIMLIKLLGPDYEVWDKAASIRFRRPGRGRLEAVFVVTDEVLERLRRDADTHGKAEHTFTVELKDAAGVVCMSCEKLLFVRRRSPSA